MGEYSMANAANVYYETPKFICKFPNLEETEKFQEQDTGSYSVTMCFSKEEVDAVEIEKKIMEAASNDPKVSKAKDWHNPLKDGDETGKDWSMGCWVLKAKTKFEVKAVDAAGASKNVDEIIWDNSTCRAHVVFRPYVAGGNMGVTCSLRDIQYIEGNGSIGGSSVPTYTPLEDVPF
jgi:hypothetical protein|tara:strand:+ start:1005 stop:1535 length:531 start_codon:yes stop_codon:yes gene_type:complete